MKDRQRIKCPECGGAGVKKVPNIKGNSVTYKEKPCRKCRGHGYLRVVLDHRLWNRRIPRIILPNSINHKPKIWLPKGAKKK